MNETTGLTAVIPMKPLIDGKSRLASVFTDQQRGDLVIGMLTTVINAVKGAGVESFVIVGGDQRVARVGEDTGGRWVPDPGVDLNDTLKTDLSNLMGIDHEKLTYRFSGRDFRLTDVAGDVIHKVIV